MTDNENEWLDSVRPMIMEMDPDVQGSIKASGVQCLIREIDRLRAELAGRRAVEGKLKSLYQIADRYRQYPSHNDDPIVYAADHIDYLEGAMIDLLNNEGRALREAGAAEERARIVEALRRAETWSIQTVLDMPPLPDLLPPQAARLALEREKAKVAVLRAACERIVEIGQDARPVLAPGIAATSLEATE